MKFILIAVSVIFAVANTVSSVSTPVADDDKFLCESAPIPEKLEKTLITQMTMADKCLEETKEQIRTEIDASMTYLAMGAHFSKDTVNLPGFAKFFFNSADEEREHAIKLIEYLLMRTSLSDVTDLITVKPVIGTWDNGLTALEAALKKEVSVTDSIRHLIKTCEEEKVKSCLTEKCVPGNDYHFVDYLTGEFLEEQYNGQRELAGKISTLSKMMGTSKNAKLAQFLFDKQM